MEIQCCCCCSDMRIILEDDYGDNPDDAYRCCRGAVHIKRAAMYVAISALVLSAFTVICMAFGVYTVNFALDVLLVIVNTIVAIVLLLGLWREDHRLVVPFIVAEVSQCAIFFFIADYVLYFTVINNQQYLRKFDQLLMVVSIYVGILIAASAVWVAAKCYHYLRERRLNGMPNPRCLWS